MVIYNFIIKTITSSSLFFNNQLFRGNRATKIHADGFAAFGSPNMPALAKAGINIELVKGKLLPNFNNN